MLQAMRDGAHSKLIKFVLFGLMTLGVGGLVFMDIGGYFRRGVSLNDVAKIGHQTIGLRAFDQTVRTILRRQGLDPELAYRLGYIDQILVGEVQSILLYKSANDLGIRIGDKEVAGQINRLVEPLLDGSTSPQQALNQILATQGINEQQFVNSIRQEMTNTLLRTALQSGASIAPDVLARDLYVLDNEKRKIEYFMIEEEDFAAIERPDDETLNKFYELIKADFAVPERRTFTIAVINPELVSNNIEITEEELRQIYEENIEYYTLPEKRKMAQAIVDTQDKALKIYEQAVAGKPLKTAVLEVTGSEESFAGESEYEREGLIENVAEAVFSLEEGGISQPVQTPLGWHVIKVTAIEAPGKIPFDEVKEEIRKEHKQALVSD